MYIVLICTCILPITCTYEANSLRISKQNTRKIYGGVPCRKNEYASVVSLRDYLGHRCGGTLITAYLVLTAAHCKPVAKDGKAVAGLGGSASDIQESEIADIFLYPTYSEKDEGDDIAILLLKKPIKETQYVKYSFIPPHKITKYLQTCYQVLSKGWGRTQAGSRSNRLMCVNLPMITSKECQRVWGTKKIESVDRVLCTLSKEGKDTCNGDSGGPLMCNNVQIGVVAWGGDCGATKEPGVYMRIDHYLHFIEHVKKRARDKIATSRTGKYPRRDGRRMASGAVLCRLKQYVIVILVACNFCIFIL